MKTRRVTSIIMLLCSMILISSHQSGRASNMISTNVVGGNTGWFSANIWKTNDGFGNPGATFGTGHPSAGNTYTLLQGPNPALGNNTTATKTRNLYTNGTPTPLWTFPGDSLELTTNTEIRFKQIVTPATIETVNFPGVGGNPGLILNGGMLNVGDDINQRISGLIQAVPGTQSYLCPGNNDGASVSAARAFTISANIVGSGTVVLFEAATNNANSITSSNNTYSGLWIVKAGRLLGAATNALGTNSSFLMDPNYVLPVPPFSSTAPIFDVAGPAVLEVNYNMMSAGTLTLVNGGRMRLHQNIVFTAATIEGTPLTAGPHFYGDLILQFPNSFDPGGSGSITIGPYGTQPSSLPSIVTQPTPQLLHPGRTAHFSVVVDTTSPPPITYIWRTNGVNLANGGNVAGATSAALTISSVSANAAANYDVVVTGPGGSVTSSVAALTIVALTGEAYEAAVAAANPTAFYQLNETGDPATNNSPAYDYDGGYNGTYGNAVQNGNPTYNIAGPRTADGYPGFAGGNAAAQLANLNANARVSVTPWNLSNNTVTLTAWVNPSGPQNPNNGLVFCRGGGTVAGLSYGSQLDTGGNATLSYNWNNEYETYSWISGLTPPAGQWSFVALVVTPSNATIHVMNTNGLLTASQAHPHIVQSFAGTTLIGDDSAGAGGARVFSGIIDDVGVFNRALSKAELFSLYTNASGVELYAPIIASQPVSQTKYAGETAQFTVVGGGSDPLTYQWQSGPIGGPYTNLANGGKISGSTSPTLTIANVSNAEAVDYLVILANPVNSATSSVVTLTVTPTSPADTITMDGVLQPAPLDWDTVGNWSDGQAASVSAAQKPGSTYELRPSGGLNTRMRSPQNPTIAVFPGDVLIVSGNAIWTNNPATNGATSEIRFKQPPNTAPPNMGAVPGVVYFKKLVMNGGQLDVGNEGLLVLQGELNILTNAPIYSDSGGDRGYRIESRLTGNANGSIEYHGYNQTSFQSNYVNNLNIAGTSNTFSGKWNIVLGTLLATGTNCLGTNDIFIGTQAAFEPTYNINNTNATLSLSGRMYLHQNHTFKSVFVNGVPLAVGTYSFATLNASYPTNFPNTWMPQTGAETYTNGGSGSITVLVQPAPQIVQQPVSVSVFPSQTAQFTIAAQGNPPLFYRWRTNGVNLNDGGNLSGSGTTNLVITNVVAGNAGNYTVVVSNSVGSVTSVVAVLTVLPTGPPLNITLDFGGTPIVQPQNNDWNTPNQWSDGNAASYSALTNPGSTYVVVAGARLRSPPNSANESFPGDILRVDGDGIYADNGTPTISEIRFKHIAGGVVRFPRLIMNGGQLDSGDNGLMVIAGRMDVLANTPIYADSAAGQDRPYQIDAWLTGGGSIEYHAFNNSFSGNLNITGTTNTYTGTWNIVQGVLLGSGANSLGTNNISIGATAALETLYNVNNPNGSLYLFGQMFLHQNDTFKNVVVGGTWLAPGTYTFAQLNTMYPAYFPASWPQQSGSGFNTGSGSITVLGPPVTISAQLSGSNLQLTWPQGILLEADDLAGPWTPNLSAVSPFTITPAGPQKFYRIQIQ